jgi:acyl-CoA hydrolase
MKFETNFTVLPRDCNYMQPLIFGGEFMARLDIAAAQCVTQLLQHSDTECDNAVTYKANFEFHKPSFQGDTIFINCEITELRYKAVKVEVKAYRTPRVGKFPKREHVATAEFVFVTRIGDKYAFHGLQLDS